MSCRKIKLMKFVMSMVILVQCAIAVSKPACDELAFEVIFKDMGYGIGTGAVFTGLYLAAADTNYHTGSALANGALLGAVLGSLRGF